MNEAWIGRIILASALAAAVIALVLWLNVPPPSSLQAREPGMDKAGEVLTGRSSSTVLNGKLERSAGVPADLPGAWPRFRGSRFDNIARDGVPLARELREGEARTLWSIEVGEGHAGAAVLDGCVYLLDYDRANQADALRCLSLADGAEIWRFSYPVKIKRNHGMSRTVPAVTEEYVVSLGPKCHVACLDSKTGELRWMKDLVREYGADVPPWYAGQCPLIDGGRVILAPGGEALMAAVDAGSGEVVWETPNPRGWKMTHSSVIPMDFAGRRMYVYCGSGGVAGISAEDGSLLWDTLEWKIKIANVPSPVIVGPDRIFLSGGYESGSMMLELLGEAGGIEARPVFRLDPEIFGSPQHTPVFYEGHIYGVRPDGQLVCLDLEGRVVWTSGSAHKFGLGPYMIAGELIYVMNDSGLLSLIEATPEAFNLLAQADVLEGHDSWGPMAFAAGRLILRDLTRMVCLDVSAR